MAKRKGKRKTLWVTDRPDIPPRRHHYTPAVLALGEQAKPGQVRVVNIYHDDACGIFTGGACNCSPWVIPAEKG